MLSHLKVENIFLDIETVPIAPTYSDLADNFQHLWAETKWQEEEYSPEEFYVKKAGVMAEFAKIVYIRGIYSKRTSKSLSNQMLLWR